VWRSVFPWAHPNACETFGRCALSMVDLGLQQLCVVDGVEGISNNRI
jgi:hypothetical protein